MSPCGVYPRSEEHRKKIGLINKKLGIRPPIKRGKDHPMWGKHLSKEHKKKISDSNKGKPSFWQGKKLPPEVGHKISAAKKGKKCSVEHKLSMSKANRGKKNPNWRGGITSFVMRVRRCYLYKKWRREVFKRDNFTCQKCNKKGGRLEAHHIKPFKKLIKEAKVKLPLFDLHEAVMVYKPMWDPVNGITLCKKCHGKFQ